MPRSEECWLYLSLVSTSDSLCAYMCVFCTIYKKRAEEQSGFNLVVYQELEVQGIRDVKEQLVTTTLTVALL